MRLTPSILILTLSVAAPAAAADHDAASTTATSDAADRSAGADVDWSLPPVHFGATERGSILPALYASLAGLQAFDAYSTTVGLKGGAAEGNAVMTGIVGNTPALWAVKGGAAFASIYAAERLWKEHRRAQAIGVMIASNAVMAVVAVHNAAVVRQLR